MALNILDLFKTAIKCGASDVHLVAGEKPLVRVYGELKEITKQEIIRSEDLLRAVATLTTKEQISAFTRDYDLDFACEVDGVRFRINLHRQRGQLALAARLIAQRIPTPEEIGFDEVIYKITHYREGLILVTGPTGSGKSTTLATMIELINQERRCHIVTLEDPIEYLYPKGQGLVEQREVGRDTHSFNSALKYVLRQDPDVILIGEMRDLETISSALTAAETGHLVLSTLHTPDAARTIERIIDMFDGNRQNQVLVQLAGSLRAVIAQQMLPTTDGHLTVAREILINNVAAANLIRHNKVFQIPSVIQTGREEGMITMNMALKNLYQNDIINETTYKNRLVGSDRAASYY